MASDTIRSRSSRCRRRSTSWTFDIEAAHAAPRAQTVITFELDECRIEDEDQAPCPDVQHAVWTPSLREVEGEDEDGIYEGIHDCPHCGIFFTTAASGGVKEGAHAN